MKRLTILLTAIALLMSGTVFVSQALAQTESISGENVAMEIAQNADGVYVQGSTAPALTGTQVALPIVDESTNEILGYIVADQSKLVSALNAAGFTEVSTALAAIDAGTVAGTTVIAGLSAGTITAAAAGAAVVIGLAVSGGGSSGGSTTTTTSHH